MELKDFIKTAIKDITEAVRELQGELDNGAVINPTVPGEKGGKTLYVDGVYRTMERLDFDIAVTASENTEVNGKAAAGISVFGARVGAESAEKTENVSRLTFSIPVVLPSIRVKTESEATARVRQENPSRVKTRSQCPQDSQTDQCT